MARDLSQVQRRVTLTHELIHDEWGVPHEDDPAEEARIEQEVAHRLIPLDLLIDVRCARTQARGLLFTEKARSSF